MKPRIAYVKPSITELEIGYATDAVRNGWGDACYEYIHRFEARFREHLGTGHAVATSSCTGALHLGLAALGIGPGDEVILADTNWVASVAPVVHLGATPVFVDILEDSWTLDPVQVEAAITPRTRAIIAVHLYGNLCRMGDLLAIGTRHGIPVIEDAAEALGSVDHGRRAGTLGRFAVFSFHGSKTVTTGEGGMFVTDDAALHDTVQTLSSHGRARGEKRQFWPERIGYKYKISNVQAAIGYGQLERIDDLLTRKRAILQNYRELLAGLPGIALNPEPPGTVNGAWMPTAVFARETRVTREALLDAFAEENIDARVFFHPLTSLPVFGGRARFPRAADIAARAINLPSYHDMTDADQERVAATVRRVMARTHPGGAR